MKLTTVLSSVNLNPEYYFFIPKQIKFWGRHGIKFIAILVADYLPRELYPFSSNIILWKRNKNINNVFLSQHLRIYYPALLNLPDDELCMITDMDMLPIQKEFYTDGLESFKIDDFIYYNDLLENQIIMCYNAAHPKTWAKVFNIFSENDIEKNLNETYQKSYSGIPSGKGWFIDQEIMYKNLINYSNLKILKRPIKRLEKWLFNSMFKKKKLSLDFNDFHCHRSFHKNLIMILTVEKLLGI